MNTYIENCNLKPTRVEFTLSNLSDKTDSYAVCGRCKNHKFRNTWGCTPYFRVIKTAVRVTRDLFTPCIWEWKWRKEGEQNDDGYELGDKNIETEIIGCVDLKVQSIVKKWNDLNVDKNSCEKIKTTTSSFSTSTATTGSVDSNTKSKFTKTTPTITSSTVAQNPSGPSANDNYTSPHTSVSKATRTTTTNITTTTNASGNFTTNSAVVPISKTTINSTQANVNRTGVDDSANAGSGPQTTLTVEGENVM